MMGGGNMMGGGGGFGRFSRPMGMNQMGGGMGGMGGKYKMMIIIIITDLKSNQLGISLLLPGDNLENIWNFVLPEKWEPCYLYS